MRRLALALAVLSLPAALATTAAAGASGSTPSLQASPTLVTYGRSVTLSGHAPAASAKVTLEADPFPFRRGYHRVASTNASSAGDYRFIARPSHATRYRVLVGLGEKKLISGAVSVYVDDRVLALSCNLCDVTNTSGSHRLTVEYSAKAPPGKLAASGPVYFYYGLVKGTSPPERLRLVKKVALRRHGHTLSYSVTYSVDFPATAFAFRVAACFRDVEADDGVGLPGHHHCGQRTLSRRQYLGYLG